MRLVNNQNGFTLVEVIMAGSISAAIVLGGFYFFQRQNKDISKSQAAIEKTLDGFSFESTIRKDLFETKYSFNTLLVKDDSNQNFFDYLPDGKCTSNCPRTITLNKQNKENAYSKEIYFLTKDKSSSVEVLIKPEDAYNYSSKLSNDNSNLSFVSLNKDGNLALKENSPWVITDIIKTRLILLYSPTYVYSSTAVTGQTPGRIIQFLGWLKNSNINSTLIAERIGTDQGELFYNLDPRDNVQITSEDIMLKHVPYRAGSGVFTLAAPVTVIRMRIKTVKENGKLIGKLYRDTLVDKNQYTENVIASNVTQMLFTRDSISSSSINLKITYEK